MKKDSFGEAEKKFKKYPYFIVPDIEALEDADPEQRTILARRIAAAVGDEAALRGILGIDPEQFASFYPDMKLPELSTEDTISSFISHFAPEAADSAQEPVSESIPVAPAIDYAALLESDEEDHSTTESENPDATDDAISNFLANVPAKKPKRKPASDTKMPTPTEAAGETDTPNLSEALFKIMVKNGNYTKALEIITDISLNNPKKSIYFADQIRFLKKLIKYQEKSSES